MTTTDNRTYAFQGNIKAVTPLAVSRKEDQFDSVGQPKNTTRLPRKGPKRVDTPVYWPSTTLRGKLRRSCYEALREALVVRNGEDYKLSLQSAFMLIQGVDISTDRSTSKETADGQFDAGSSLRIANPFLSLWGRWKMGARVGVDNAYPKSTDCVTVMGAGARSNHYIRTPDARDELGLDDQALLSEIIRADSLAAKDKDVLNKEIKALTVQVKDEKDPEEKAAIRAQIQELQDEVKALKSQKVGASEAIQRPLEGFEAIIPGTEMEHRVFLRQVGEFELGLYLAGLRKLSEFPLMGGHFSQGCGEIAAEWEVNCLIDRKPVTVGKVKLGMFQFELEGEALKAALAQWDLFASGSDGEEFRVLDFDRYLFGN